MSDRLGVRPTPIPGLLIVDLVVHGDERGWFKENWQRSAMTALGLPDFGPVQHNVSYNHSAGVTRGLHAEPWDKLVSVVRGRVFGAWVDLREGEGFGRLFTVEIGPETAVFVPRGVANGFQTLDDETVYSYLVNEHWSREATRSYVFVNLADPRLSVPWPIPLASAIVSAADLAHPPLSGVSPVASGRTVIIGSSGQLSLALQKVLPDAEVAGSARLDLSSPQAVIGHPWRGTAAIVNAAGYTAVDAAETPEGRRAAWALNAGGPAALARIAREFRCPLVHVSSDYVFDGSVEVHDEEEQPVPLGVYGQSKAAGDAAVAQLDRHYIVRTSWVVGRGRNFVSTMVALARRGVHPAVVDDQFGRLAFADDLAAGIAHLLASGARPGTYNLTNDGPVQSWCDIAREVFVLCGRRPSDVLAVSTEEYGLGKALAPRPRHSVLLLDKITAAGFAPPPASARLEAYVASLLAAPADDF